MNLSTFLGEKNVFLNRSNEFVKDISKCVKTFHHHFHIIWPLLEKCNGTVYLEIGCFSGCSLLTALQCQTLRRAISIDTFVAIPDQFNLVKKNLTISNNPNCDVLLVQGSSHDVDVVSSIYRTLLEDFNFFGIHVLFIDGDHSAAGVKLDYKYFRPLVSSNGFIIFDDYGDAQFSPEVRGAVDEIVSKNKFGDAILGQPLNSAGAFGNGLQGSLSNEFLFCASASTLEKTSAKYIICIATYRRSDGSTPQKLGRQLKCIKSQAHKDWFVLVVGDHYSDEKEFDSFKDLLPENQSLFVNLPVACERENSRLNNGNKMGLWQCAGCGAINYSLMLVQKLKRNCIYVHTDDDDSWEPNHLETLDQIYSQFQDATFVYTIGKYLHEDKLLPSVPFSGSHPLAVERMPMAEQTLHSAVSWRADQIPLRYRVNDALPSDADMWTRISQYLTEKNLKSYLANKVTVRHLTERC